jgi:phosphotransferase system enzyme I (PtsI)
VIDMFEIYGFGVGHRISSGHAFILNKSQTQSVIDYTKLSIDNAKREFEDAVVFLHTKFQNSIDSTQNIVLKEILLAQIRMASDPDVKSLVFEQLDSGKMLHHAVQDTFDEFIILLGGSGDEFEERISDLKEIKRQFLDAICGRNDEIEFPESGDWIVVARELTPLETSHFTNAIKGVIIAEGGPTSHTAIVCRQLQIPALVGCGDISMIEQGEVITIDPAQGIAFLGEPSAFESFHNWWSSSPMQSEPIFKAYGNVGSFADADKLRSSGAQGVGLLRTELLFLDSRESPSTDEQFRIYSDIVERCPEGEVIFRTLDAGTDKPIPFLNMGAESNPALGIRGQRVAVLHPDFFENQLSAIALVRESVTRHTISIMASMISTLDEALTFSELAHSFGFTSIGIMVEVPSVIEVIAELPETITFLSIGTNDLSQYLFASDRQSSRFAHLLDPWQPALIRSVKRICDSAKSRNIKVGVCGEAASDLNLAPVLCGLGIQSLSAGIGSLTDLVDLSKHLSTELASECASIALSSSTANEARNSVRRLLSDAIPS